MGKTNVKDDAVNNGELHQFNYFDSRVSQKQNFAQRRVSLSHCFFQNFLQGKKVTDPSLVAPPALLFGTCVYT